MRFFYTILSVLLMTSCIGITSNAGTTTNWKEVASRGPGPLIAPPRIEDYMSFDDPVKNAELRKKYLTDLIEYNQYLSGYITNLSAVSVANGVKLSRRVDQFVACHRPLTVTGSDKPELPDHIPTSAKELNKTLTTYVRQLWNYQLHYETLVNNRLQEYNQDCL